MRSKQRVQQEVIIAKSGDLDSCCRAIAPHSVIGLDTEFVGEDSYHPQICLIQVATPDTLFLIDPLTIDRLQPFWNLVIDPARVVVVHAGREEVRLCRLGGGAPPGNLFDIQIAAGLIGLNYPLNHGALVHQLLGYSINKGETLTEWRRRPLTAAQQRYAFDDVRYLLRLYDRILNRLKQLNRLEWAQEEFVRLESSTDPEEAHGERWRKLRGLGGLDRPRLANARALYQWRESLATRLNRPSRTILRDDLIIEIARRNPSRAEDLAVIRGVPQRDLEAIVQTIEEARQLPLEKCPELLDRDQDPPQLSLLSGILNAVLADSCARQHLAPNLVASSNDLKQIIRAKISNPADAVSIKSLLTQGWRAKHVLPDLLAVLEGKMRIRIANVGSETPLQYEND